MTFVGITGGIGAGKSVVARLFSLYGIPVYDSDSRAKTLMNSSSAIRDGLLALFGEEIYINGVLNKTFLAEKIFSDKKAREQVNSIVHPVVCNDFKEWAENQHCDIVAIESAILFESGLDGYVDKIVAVTAPYESRVKRALRRDSVSADKIEARIKSQMSQEYIIEQADYEVINDGNHSLIEQVDYIVDCLKRYK